ncbi:MAG: NAD(P)(+) transhydrogenase (Re/Si-specific) subunit alpha [Rhodospirillaceae bacterium]|nr:NAD(P)(+) transhydrogenase (Re/Si-specific) subunit alpha [Rhodospirillaceae bacterium]OUT78243.1 MAG: NAD(P) transhydrogenase subunit alpha [Rhodospirillaceae bacterium TMED23]|tara:strand:+ start:6632 stop:7777 length:1146 start_codon:yes stop_codon:yes gene_type:complete
MKIGVPKELLADETRLAVSPDSIKKYAGMGFDVVVESGAGVSASFTDQRLVEAGATISSDQQQTIKDADIVLKVRGPDSDSGDDMRNYGSKSIVIANFSALTKKDKLSDFAKTGVTAFAMDLMPRITRAQSMDILSSQSNLAGYKAVLDAANAMGRAYPMMMTAAGTIPPAKVFVMGVGVAGLQAIATAKRMGAVVTATDVRPATKEQVESLGGKFLEVDAEMEKNAQTEGGYAKEMPKEYVQKQKEVVAEHVKKQDVVITTALIPGRPAPILVTEKMVASMPDGSVIVDMAVEAGGNCPLSQLGEVIDVGNVKILGHANIPGRIAEDASQLYAKNLLNFIIPLVNSEQKSIEIDWEDEIITGTLICKNGKIVHPALTGEK